MSYYLSSKNIDTKGKKREFSVWQRLKEDIRMIKERDPAAKNYVEIFLCYPGLHASWFHRIAHSLYAEKMVYDGQADFPFQPMDHRN